MNSSKESENWSSIVRNIIESRLYAWAYTVESHRWMIIVTGLVLAVAMSASILRLYIDTSTESFLQPDDSVRIAYGKFREQFGLDDMIIIEVVSDNTFSINTVERLKQFHAELEQSVPYIEEITSLINIRQTLAEEDTLIVRTLLGERPDTQEQLSIIERNARANPLYHNFLLSDDKRVMGILIKANALVQDQIHDQEPTEVIFDFDETETQTDGNQRSRFLNGEETAEIVVAINTVIAKHQSDDFDIHITGTPVLTHIMSNAIQTGMTFYLILALLMIGTLLYGLFQRLSGVVLPLVIGLISVCTTMGMMGLVGAPIGAPTQILPTFLLVVGIASTIHLLVIFFQAFDKGNSKVDALAFALSHSGMPIIMTSLTTAGGLLSFIVADLTPVADIGLFIPFGILISLVYLLTLLPALLLSIPLQRQNPKNRKIRTGQYLEHLLVWIGDKSVDRAWTVLLVTTAILTVSILGISQLRFEYDPVSWYPEDSLMRKDLSRIDQDLGGSYTIEVLVDSGRENGLFDPTLLEKFEILHRRLKILQADDGTQIKKVISIVDVIREIHQALNDNDPDQYVIPKEGNLVAQELFLFENSGPDDLQELVDSTFRLARFTLKVPYAPPGVFHSFVQQVENEFTLVLGNDADVQMTGSVTMLSRAMDMLQTSLAKSYVIALLIIVPLMILLLGSVTSGLIAMIPNLAPIIATLGFMGWCGIPLDPFTLLIGSIAIGLAVDDTIHFMHNFRKYFEQSGCAKQAVRQTLSTTGIALFITSVVLSLSFFIYMFSDLDTLFNFGLLTGFTIIAAFISDITIAPAVMSIFVGLDNEKNNTLAYPDESEFFPSSKTNTYAVINQTEFITGEIQIEVVPHIEPSTIGIESQKELELA